MMSRPKHRSSVEVCADCGASDPSWASINRGLLLCAECCSVHRSLGRHISHVKSLRQGYWPPSLLTMVQALTAQNVNSIWEHSLLDSSAPKHLRKKPQPKDPLHPVKHEFILAKHLRLAYVVRARRDEPASELDRALHAAVRSSQLHTAMRLLAQGADPNYYNVEKGTFCIHAACRAGQASQAELLVAWGADPAVVDHAGRDPAAAANLAGHNDLAERMSELINEAPLRLAAFLTGERVRHPSAFLAPPRHTDQHEMTDVAKAARGKLQLLPNHLFEELVMDLYDEVDRRETEAIWQTSTPGLERSGVVFLPVNPALSAPRNQGRQKLARLSTNEMATLLRDVLVDATRRQHIATLQPRALGGVDPEPWDDEPLYDCVASDDDYAALDSEMTLPGETNTSTQDTPSFGEQTSFASRQPIETEEIETLKKQLDNKDTTITELKNQLKNLQTIVEQLTKENSVLKTTGADENGVSPQTSISEMTDVTDNPKIQERGKSLDSEAINAAEEPEVRQAVKMAPRPVSMFETRQGPNSNWHITKHQLTTLSSFDPTPLSTAIEMSPESNSEAVQRRAESVTRGLQALWAAARDHMPLVLPAAGLRTKVHDLLDLFDSTNADQDQELAVLLHELETACEDACAACEGPTPVVHVRNAAYELARATKRLVTRCQEQDSDAMQ